MAGKYHDIFLPIYHSRLMCSARPADVVPGRSSTIKSYNSLVTALRHFTWGNPTATYVSLV